MRALPSDRATRASTEPASGLGHSAGIPSALDELLNAATALLAACETTTFSDQYPVECEAMSAALQKARNVPDLVPILLEACQRVVEEKAPSYHDCIDNGEPECAWCTLFDAVATATGEA